MDDYCAHFSNRKRKVAGKERETVAKQGGILPCTLGNELTSDEIDFFYLCDQSTDKKCVQQGYLTRYLFG